MIKTKRRIYSPLMFRKKQKKHWFGRLPIFRLNILIAIIVFCMMVGNLVMLNSITSNGYKAKEVQKQVLEFNNKNQDLSLDISNKRAMESVLFKVEELGMVEAKNISFITMPDTSVARK